MAQPKKALPVDPDIERQQRIDAVMNELRPKLDAMLQKMVETIVDARATVEIVLVVFTVTMEPDSVSFWAAQVTLRVPSAEASA